VPQPADSPERRDAAVTPLYARLPRGPHRMKRREVAENQRQRMHGAMVEAIAAHGYGGTSVKQVISLAGVSRRAFYEQFANKQECFSSTVELLAERAGDRIGAAYSSGGTSLERRMDAGIRALLELIASNPKSIHLALIDAPTAGPAGWEALTKALLGFECTLFESFARTPGASTLPRGVVRGITGGIHMMILRRVCQRRTSELPKLANPILRWTLAAHSPAAARLPALGGPARGESQWTANRRGTDHPRAGPVPGVRDIGTIAGGELAAERSQTIQSVLDAIALEGVGNLSPLGIVDRAEVSIDTFFDLFGDVEGCVLAALADLSEELLGILSELDPQAQESWSLQVKRLLVLLMDHLARHPSHAHAITTGAFEMGQPGIDLSLKLAAEIARALLVGAPCAVEPTGGDLIAEGVAGAIWHTVYWHAVRHQVEMLPASVEALAYLVLAPFVGAEQAVQTALSEPSSVYGLSRPSDRARRSETRPVSRAAL
jgi:AcrR family transcriptional regulator